MRLFRSVLLVLLVLLATGCQGFELQDTIHALIEENIQLHDQLENLTQALRELKRMLWHHANDPDHHEHHEHHNEEVQHLWEEWSELAGVSAETHRLLEEALCGHHPHSSAPPLLRHTALLLLLPLLLACL